MRTLLMLLLITVSSAYGGESASDPVIEFSSKGYTVSFQITSDLSDSLILASLFEFQHIIRYGSKTSLKMTHLHPRDTVDRIRYDYDYTITRMSMIMNRVLNQKEKRVQFALEQFSSESRMLPHVVSVGGGYTLSTEKGLCTVNYRQITQFQKPISKLFLLVVKHETKLFIKEYLAYLKKLRTERPTVT